MKMAVAASVNEAAADLDEAQKLTDVARPMGAEIRRQLGLPKYP